METVYPRWVQIRIGRLSILLLAPFTISACLSPPRGLIILCAGDSITAEAYPHYLQRLLAAEGVLARVLNRGRSGHASGEYLAYLIKNEDRLKAERPDFILLQLGTNDVRVDADHTPTAAFVSNMKRILALFRGLRGRTGRPPVILLATIPPVPAGTPLPFSAESSARVTSEINPAIRALAAEESVPLVDNFALFEREPDLLPGIHPSRDGYRRLAGSWLAALKAFPEISAGRLER